MTNGAKNRVTYRIPFNKSFVTGRELGYVDDVLRNHSTSGDGLYSKKCQELMQQAFSANKVLLTTSCTSAMEMSVLLCDLKAGDEVILPSFTFVSTANALAINGVTPRFVDIRQDTKNLNEALVEEAINENTKAIMPVHYAGVSCDMNTIREIAGKHGLRVIEDAAQGVNSSYNGDYLGTLGDLGCFSFHETKNYSSGEGGALLINDDALVERAEILREKGTDRSRFFRGQVDKYSWVDIGSSYLPSDVLAALLLAQLESLDEINEQRQRVFERYKERLQCLADEGHIELPFIPEDCQANNHMFYILVENQGVRTALTEHLKGEGILAVFHYVPLHDSTMGKKLGLDKNELPVTASVSERLLRLPMYCDLSDSDVDLVCDSIVEFYRQ
jgi:dTDP-4-amino-4,6-dideoxygalactose transaminase